jgi:hypothetical protein
MGVRIQAEAGTGNSEDFVKSFGPFLQSTSIEVIDISDNDFLKQTTIALLEYSVHNPKLKLICERNELTSRWREIQFFVIANRSVSVGEAIQKLITLIY